VRVSPALVAAAFALCSSSCFYPPDLNLTPEILAPEPMVRVGLPAANAAVLQADSGLLISDDDGILLATTSGPMEVAANVRNGVISLRSTDANLTRPVIHVMSRAPDGLIRLGGRQYRGAMELRPVGNSVLVINVIGLEAYLAGVVGAELGRRAPGEEAALQAQAITSRTYALRNLGRWREQGYDLASDVSAQVYAGVLHESAMTRAAVESTRGQVLMWQGQPIDAFYSSTCAGHTEAGVAAFAGADRPYLQALPDTAPGGTAWCAISPRYEWTETWTGAQLLRVLQRSLMAERLASSRASDLRDIEVVERNQTNRIVSLDLIGRGGRTRVSGQGIRRVLSPVSGGWLRSTDFRIRVSHNGSRIERVVVTGRGNGHGVGLCQWGAIGRARGGQDYLTILMNYFPGTELKQLY
jgi:stage II sporulation protein D